eukprot:scaffold12532_cov156-Isochrysis_galbana.AAC.1
MSLDRISSGAPIFLYALGAAGQARVGVHVGGVPIGGSGLVHVGSGVQERLGAQGALHHAGVRMRGEAACALRFSVASAGPGRDACGDCGN